MARSGNIAATLVLAAVCVALWFAPPPQVSFVQEGETRRARVVEIDDSTVETHGLLRFGTQHLKVRLLDGPRKGETFSAVNEIRAQMDLDKHFVPGDTAVVVERGDEDPKEDVIIARDHWRAGWAAVLKGHKSHLVAHRIRTVPAAVLADKGAFGELPTHGCVGEIQTQRRNV